MSLASTRHHVTVVHYPTEPGKAPLFFLKTCREGDPANCQRLVSLDAAQLTALSRSIEAAANSARAMLNSRLETNISAPGHA